MSSAAPPGLPPGEAKRKLLHILVGGFAFLLRFITWPEAALLALAALLFNWRILPLVGGRGLWRGEERDRGYPRGILLYPLSVLALILAFRTSLWMAAAVWGVLAFGDGMAGVVGQGVGGPRLPWNRRKGWAGLSAFVVFGALGSSLLAAWTLRLPLASALSPRLLAIAVPLALVSALVESHPTTLDDNLTVPLVGGVLIPFLAMADVHNLSRVSDLGGLAGAGFAANALFALAALLTRSIDVPGAVSAVLIGTVITVGVGLPGLALMVAFFVIGSAATRVGYRIKAERGIAQERGGARGWRNAWANGGVPAFLALMAALGPAELHALLGVAYAAAVATAAADTCSSEFGKAFGRRTFLITTLKPVPPGTEGAVSLEGTLAGLGAALVLAGLGAVLGLYPPTTALLVALAGLVGSLAESVIGTVAEKRGWLDNDLLNALNTALGAAVVTLLVRLLPEAGVAS